MLFVLKIGLLNCVKVNGGIVIWFCFEFVRKMCYFGEWLCVKYGDVVNGVEMGLLGVFL